MTTRNEHTGDSLITRASSEAYRSNWEQIFGKKKDKGEQEKALAELTQLSEELGLYEDRDE